MLLLRKMKIIQLSLQQLYQLETLEFFHTPKDFRACHELRLLLEQILVVGTYSICTDSTRIKRQPITDDPLWDQRDAPKTFTHIVYHTKVKTTRCWDEPLHSTEGMHEMKTWIETILTINPIQRGLQIRHVVPSNIHQHKLHKSNLNLTVSYMYIHVPLNSGLSGEDTIFSAVSFRNSVYMF